MVRGRCHVWRPDKLWEVTLEEELLEVTSARAAPELLGAAGIHIKPREYEVVSTGSFICILKG